jgi:hypothetical protein
MDCKLIKNITMKVMEQSLQALERILENIHSSSTLAPFLGTGLSFPVVTGDLSSAVE